MIYDNSWASLNARPVPEWFSDAKFGIFIHWGLYSVPAYTKNGEYAEWYWKQIENPAHPARAFHDRVYGRDFRYEDFAPLFRAELFDPDEWADIFTRAGARYINLVSKHHDGYCLFDSSFAPGWNSVATGPRRDFCAELKKSLDSTPVRFGVYHSVYEWHHPLYLENPERYALEHLLPMLRELIEKYQPATLFTDGEWDHESAVWHSTDFLQWLYNDSSVRDFIVPNDRWGSETRGALGGNFTTEYGEVAPGRTLADAPDARPFEECRGIGRSFGLNRAERAGDYLDTPSLIWMLAELVSKGGNLLLNVGPSADGKIPPIMEERLLGIGKWLSVCGEAIYGTRGFALANEADTFCTAKGGAVYAMRPAFPAGRQVFSGIRPERGMKVSLLGCPAPLELREENGAAAVLLPALTPADIACGHMYVYKFEKAAGR